MAEKSAELRGRAALGLLESLLAVLVEREVLTRDEVDEVFATAADAFRTAGHEGLDGENEAIARLLEKVQVGSDGVTRR